MKRILIYYKERPFQGLQTFEDVSKALGASVPVLKRFAYAKSGNYFLDTEPKSDGTTRTLHKPHKKLKAVQRRILRSIEKVPLGACVYGLHKRRGIADNARLHSKSTYVARFDIRAFFPTIHPTTIKSIFIDLGCGDEAASLLTGLTTYNHQLPQGAPTSNYLSALVLHNVDYRLQGYTRSMGLLYSRYFDDITISGKKDLRVVEKKVQAVVREAGYTLNRNKTRFFGPQDEKTITGVTIRDGRLCAPKQESEVNTYLEKMEAGDFLKKQIDHDKAHVVGLIAFLNQINPKLSRAMKKRYLVALTKR